MSSPSPRPTAGRRTRRSPAPDRDRTGHRAAARVVVDLAAGVQVGQRRRCLAGGDRRRRITEEQAAADRAAGRYTGWRLKIEDRPILLGRPGAPSTRATTAGAPVRPPKPIRSVPSRSGRRAAVHVRGRIHHVRDRRLTLALAVGSIVFSFPPVREHEQGEGTSSMAQWEAELRARDKTWRGAGGLRVLADAGQVAGRGPGAGRAGEGVLRLRRLPGMSDGGQQVVDLDQPRLTNAEAYVRRAILTIYLDGYRRQNHWSGLKHLLADDDRSPGADRVATARVDVGVALAKLSPRQREAVVSLLRGLDRAADRDRPGTRPGTITRYLSDAIELLRGSLAEIVAPSWRRTWTSGWTRWLVRCVAVGRRRWAPWLVFDGAGRRARVGRLRGEAVVRSSRCRRTRRSSTRRVRAGQLDRRRRLCGCRSRSSKRSTPGPSRRDHRGPRAGRAGLQHELVIAGDRHREVPTCPRSTA